MSGNTLKVGCLQIGSHPEGKQATLDVILSYESAIQNSGVQLLVLPEATLGGYPKGETFGTYLGYRLPEGREQFRLYHANAIDVPEGPEVKALEEFARRAKCFIVIGVIERAAEAPSTLYCTALYIDPEEGYCGKHRKLMPTATERLIWGQGDGSTLEVLSPASLHHTKVAAAICWENYMPLLRMSYYAKGVQVYCAPTVDEREMWRHTMQHIAAEGRCFVASAVQIQGTPDDLHLPPEAVPGWARDRRLINGGSVIVDPLGTIVAGPLVGEEGLISAEIDLNEVVKGKYDFDVAGHYGRGDIFQLTVDERQKSVVKRITD
ncbi:nitrilase [Angomonas deanei]|uniref:Carbon-nitrogen hydrolase, putative n=1 Tax=Angomonas deanei TaxID=59799 RepID=S9UJZ3_9TRYP|nr:nitrilase [Angomonas deanei]EPY19548.1 nitrilase [Angomonas deanei]CAD2215769.1 Carbon-nitrogen hydrolase, putative [Angomonas deanei]|eukprot:EPY15006.1 nitrilase [Angomonas deanei]